MCLEYLTPRVSLGYLLQHPSNTLSVSWVGTSRCTPPLGCQVTTKTKRSTLPGLGFGSLFGGSEGALKACRRRKARTVFSDHQLGGLEKRFAAQRYLSTPERVELATSLNLSETQVSLPLRT